MANKIKVVIKEVGASPREAEVLNNLKTFQTLVDGFIEVVSVNIAGKNGLMVINEEGKLRGDCKFNFDYKGLDQIFGDAVFIGSHGDNFSNCPFSVEEVEGFLNDV